MITLIGQVNRRLPVLVHGGRVVQLDRLGLIVVAADRNLALGVVDHGDGFFEDKGFTLQGAVVVVDKVERRTVALRLELI